MVRTVTQDNNPAELWLYRFADKQEQLIERKNKHIVMSDHFCLSPDRKRLAWIGHECEDSENTNELRIFNLETNEIEQTGIVLDKGAGWNAQWMPDSRLSVWGIKYMAERSSIGWPQLLRYNPDDKSIENFSSKELVCSLNFSRDFTFAIVMLPQKMGEAYGLLNTGTDEIIKLPRNGSKPVWDEEKRQAFRILRNEGKSFLSMIDPETGAAKTLWQTDIDVSLIALSYDHKYALLMQRNALIGTPCLFVRISDGKVKRFDPAGLSKLLDSYNEYPPISRDGKWLILELYGVPSKKTWMYRIPEDW